MFYLNSNNSKQMCIHPCCHYYDVWRLESQRGEMTKIQSVVIEMSIIFVVGTYSKTMKSVQKGAMQ